MKDERSDTAPAVDAASEHDRHADDPLLAALEAAPFDDEPFPAHQRAAAAAALREYRRGEASPLADARRAFARSAQPNKPAVT